MATLTSLLAREVLDSRGRPTVEVEAVASDGTTGLAIVPAGASTGRHEARELRDGDPLRHRGLGVRRAVENVRTQIAPAVVGMDLDDQEGLDARLIALDGTPERGRLGANAILGTSLAAAHAAAAARREPLYAHLHRLWRRRLDPGTPAELTMPLPMVNLISGGLHAGRQLDVQDFLAIPVGARGYGEALEMAAAIYAALGEVLREAGEEADLVGDEGGYGPRLRAEGQALDRIVAAARRCGLEPGRDVAIAIDVAATHFLDADTGRYRLRAAGEPLDAIGMIDLLEGWARQYPIASIEDGLAEDDWGGWAAMTARLGATTQLVGDDLFATQVARLGRGIELGAANAVLIKPNQVGTLTETLEALALARRAGYRAIVSARSGETEDTTIADLAVATGSGQIKIGSVARSERLAKYNRLLRIEVRLGPSARFAGREILVPRA